MRSTIHILPFLLILLFSCSVEENNGDDDDEKTSISVSSLENNSIVQDTILIFCESNSNFEIYCEQEFKKKKIAFPFDKND